MSIASRYGKLRFGIEDDGTRARRLEDLLTADVFGAYRYLPVQLGIGPLLGGAANIDGQSLADWADRHGVAWATLTHQRTIFWPSLGRREPDLIVLLGDEPDCARLAVLLEVKLHSEQHEIDGTSQLGYYARGLLEGQVALDDTTHAELADLCPAVLLTKDGTMPIAALATARHELGEHHAGGRSDAFWVSWLFAAETAAKHLDQRRADGGEDHELAVLEDVVADLDERGFRRPRRHVEFPLPELEQLRRFPIGWSSVLVGRSRPRHFGEFVDARLREIDDALRRWRLR